MSNDDFDNKLKKLNEESHICAHEVLHSTAKWLEDPNNEIYALLEDNEKSLKVAAEYCVLAAKMLKKASIDVQLVSGVEYKEKGIIEALESLKAMADSFDQSDNPELHKRASVLDEIMIIIADDAAAQRERKEAYDKRIEAIKNKVNGKVVEKKAQEVDEKPPKEDTGSLSTRYCPDHHGVSTYRKSDVEWQCPIDGKSYNYRDGFTTEDGVKHPGASVEGQTQLDSNISNPLPYGDTKDK